MNDHDFFPVDRLVEFGLSMAVAQQMVQGMNTAISQMHVPGAMNPSSPQPTQLFYAVLDDKQSGPYSETEISRLVNEKTISKDTLMWKPGMPNWAPAEEIPEILKLVVLIPPPLPPQK